jgi:hypothetical protein
MRPIPRRGFPTARRPPSPPLPYLLPLPDPAWSLEHYLNQFDAEERAALSCLYAIWEDLNRRYFGGRLKTPFLSIPDFDLWFDRELDWRVDGPYGTCGLHPVLAGRVRIEIRYDLAMSVRDLPGAKACSRRRWWRFTRDVLLHECIHQWHFEVAGRGEARYGGHGPAFARTCNRIGQRLGFKPVTSPRLSQMPAEDCRFWPDVVAPRGTYPARLVKESSQRVAPSWIGRPACPRYVRRRPQIVAAGAAAIVVDRLESAGR